MQPSIAWGDVTIDACDSASCARFWGDLLKVRVRSQTIEGWFQLGPLVPGGPVVNIQPVPERKIGKTRLHLDLWTDDVDGAIELVERLGGHRIDEHSFDAWRIAVMSDPEGIEFCLVGS